MPRDNYGKYDNEGNLLVPMEPKWGNPDKGSPKLREIMDNYYVDKTHPDSWRSDSDASDPNRRIPKGYTPVANQYDPDCNYDGYQAGNKIIVALDEYKVAESTTMSVQVVYAEDHQTIDGQNGKERI